MSRSHFTLESLYVGGVSVRRSTGPANAGAFGRGRFLCAEVGERFSRWCEISCWVHELCIVSCIQPELTCVRCGAAPV